MNASRPIPPPTVSYRLLPSQRHPDCLRLEIPVQRIAPEIAPESRGFESAERGAGVVEVVAVDPDGAGADGARSAVRLLDVLRPDPRREAVHRPVGELHSCVEAVEGEHRE